MTVNDQALKDLLKAARKFDAAMEGMGDYPDTPDNAVTLANIVWELRPALVPFEKVETP